MSPDEISALAWEKQAGLLPAIVQDAGSHRVLMLGYMDRAALEATLATGRVTFYSRSKQRLWMKGETSGDILELVSLEADCDADTILVQAKPRGDTCHLGRKSCFPSAPGDFLAELDAVLEQHELVKVKIGAEDREARDTMIGEIAEKSGSAVVQRIGHVAVLYRPSKDHRHIVLPRK